MVSTAWRMLITHRQLLEWNPSDDSDRSRRSDLARSSFRTLWIGPFIAAATLVTLAAFSPAGSPGLGLDLIIASHASALALMMGPEAVCLNLERLAADGYEPVMASMKRSTTRRLAFRTANRAPSPAPSWPITKA